MRPIRYSEPSSSVFLRVLGRTVGHSELTLFGSHSAHVFDRSVSPAQRVQRTFAHTLRYCWVGYKNRVARRHSSNRPVLSKCSKHTDTNACVCATDVRQSETVLVWFCRRRLVAVVVVYVFVRCKQLANSAPDGKVQPLGWESVFLMLKFSKRHVMLIERTITSVPSTCRLHRACASLLR